MAEKNRVMIVTFAEMGNNTYRREGVRICPLVVHPMLMTAGLKEHQEFGCDVNRIVSDGLPF
jgi:predicted  nucleic acid-binding Zn ribbon protein